MKINWEINYKFKIAKCSQITVAIREVDVPTTQIYKNIKIGFGFTKIESKKTYKAYIINMSNELFKKIKEDPNILANYGSQLGDSFNEYLWNDEREIDMKQFLGKFPKQQELANYLGVNKATVSGYSKIKKKLWLNGLWIIKRLNNF